MNAVAEVPVPQDKVSPTPFSKVLAQLGMNTASERLRFSKDRNISMSSTEVTMEKFGKLDMLEQRISRHSKPTHTIQYLLPVLILMLGILVNFLHRKYSSLMTDFTCFTRD